MVGSRGGPMGGPITAVGLVVSELVEERVEQRRGAHGGLVALRLLVLEHDREHEREEERRLVRDGDHVVGDVGVRAEAHRDAQEEGADEEVCGDEADDLTILNVGGVYFDD